MCDMTPSFSIIICVLIKLNYLLQLVALFFVLFCSLFIFHSSFWLITLDLKKDRCAMVLTGNCAVLKTKTAPV